MAKAVRPHGRENANRNNYAWMEPSDWGWSPQCPRPSALIQSCHRNVHSGEPCIDPTPSLKFGAVLGCASLQGPSANWKPWNAVGLATPSNPMAVQPKLNTAAWAKLLICISSYRALDTKTYAYFPVLTTNCSLQKICAGICSGRHAPDHGGFRLPRSSSPPASMPCSSWANHVVTKWDMPSADRDACNACSCSWEGFGYPDHRHPRP